jgi:hypothetical protein
MSQQQYLLHIKDLLLNTQFVYNTQVITDNNHGDIFTECIKHLQSKSDTHLKYTICENYCEIYQDSETINAGWIWNSKTLQKKILYLLTPIPIYCPTQHVDKCTNVVDVATDTVANIISSQNRDFDSVKLTRSCDTTLTEPTLAFGKGTQTINLRLYPTDYDYEITPLQKFTKTFPNNLWSNNEPQCINFESLVLGDGYSRNPFLPVWGDTFTNELKKKLTIPNFGLRPTNF